MEAALGPKYHAMPNKLLQLFDSAFLFNPDAVTPEQCKRVQANYRVS